MDLKEGQRRVLEYWQVVVFLQDIGVKLDKHGSKVRREANAWVRKQTKHWEQFSELSVMI